MKTIFLATLVFLFLNASLVQAQFVDHTDYPELRYTTRISEFYKMGGDCAATKISAKQYITHMTCVSKYLASKSLVPGVELTTTKDPIISLKAQGSLQILSYDYKTSGVEIIDTSISSVRFVSSSYQWLMSTLEALKSGKDIREVQPEVIPINAAVITVTDETANPVVEIKKTPSLNFPASKSEISSMGDLLKAQDLIITGLKKQNAYAQNTPFSARAKVFYRDGVYGVAVLLEKIIMDQDQQGFGGPVWVIDEKTNQLHFAGLTASPGISPLVVEWSIVNKKMLELIHLQ